MDRGEVRKLEKGYVGETSGRAMVKTSITFATHKKGRVGYVGDINIEATQIILAMCFYPGSKGPADPGTGGPPVSVLLSYFLLLFSSYRRDEPLPRRNIVVLSLEKDVHTDKTYA